MKRIFLFVISFLILASIAYTQDNIQLPPPQTDIGKPLMQTLKLRHTTRSFSSKPLPMQEISNILWAAFGINRVESGKRTAPSAMNNQECDVYIVMQDGAYLYNAKENTLELVVKEDLRSATGMQDFVKTAPLNLVYVADFSKMGKSSDEDKLLYSGADVGFIAENVYLYCASQDLAVVIRGSVKKDELVKKLKLKKDQKVVLSQTVGYPGE